MFWFYMRKGQGRLIAQSLSWSPHIHLYNWGNWRKNVSFIEVRRRSICNYLNIRLQSTKINIKTCKILVTHCEVPKEAIDILERFCEVIRCEILPPKRSEILKKCKGVHGLYWATGDKLDAEVLDAVGPQLKSISTMSAGIDHIDVAELKRRKLPLGHTPTSLTDAVADTAMGLMLAAARRFHEGRQKIENCKWENYHIKWMLGQDIRDSTIGFYGFGRIGQAIASRLAGFNVGCILYTTRNEIDKNVEKKFNAKKASFDEMLAQSDFIFIVAPLTDETHGSFNAMAFQKMKETAILVNVARGPIVNQNDLYQALKCQEIFAAGLDVMVPEPLPADNKLLTLPNCVLLPHLGSATLRTRVDMAITAACNVVCGIAGKPMIAPAYSLK